VQSITAEVTRVKIATIVGIVLVIIGVIGLAYGGVSYTKEKTVVDIGPIKATADSKETIPVPPVLGGIALAGGIILIATAARK
jgi:hypothetical protein